MMGIFSKLFRGPEIDMEKSSASTLRSFAGIGAACFGAGLVDKKVLRSQLKDYLRENRKE